jgi:ParB family chromosome partitioning protein
MTTRKKSVLGKNLSSMLSQATLQHAAEEPGSKKDDAGLLQLSVDSIHPGPFQPRTVFDPEKLQELADSIRSQGMIQPIVVRVNGENEYQIIAGERRWRAAQLAGLEDIPAIVRNVPDEISIALALIENIQREDLNPLEEARALRRLVDEFEMTHLQAAEAVGRSRAAVSNLLRLLDLGDEVKKMVDAGQLEMGHARALLPLEPFHQLRTAREVANKQLSVRQTEKLVQALLNPPKRKPPRRTDPDILRLQDRLADRLCARVSIRHGNKGKGNLVIHYNSNDELEGILENLGISEDS